MSKPSRQTILEKFGCKCAYCGEEITVKSMQVDHVIPQSDLMYNILDGDFKKKERIPAFLTHLLQTDINHQDNLFPACGTCNKWKSSHCLETFRNEISLQITRLRRDSAAFRMAERYDLVQETGQEIEFHFETMFKYDLVNHA